ncbi:hypothetical protein FDG04_02270 [Clostridium sporogenes]|uniref:hypothetical protein n=1 Tax=Clostridium sporogenes TaxID=1509 RepID=UPI0013D1AF9B|nr:hypothetical protein [Clostridium sporogenes]NFQ84158.1 hypothetical protein [Clostridium sporogenes]
MPNWCTGDLKVRGKYKDIKEFLEKELVAVGGNILNREYKAPEVKESEYELEVETTNGGLWFKNAYRSYFESDIYIYIDCDDEDDKEKNLITANLGELKTAWGTDTNALTDLSKQYNLDFKIYAYERGMEFNIDFEVHKGEIIKNNEIKFDDYVWECTNPEIGG